MFSFDLSVNIKLSTLCEDVSVKVVTKEFKF